MTNPLLTHYANGKFGIPVSLPNRTFDPKGLNRWARLDDMPSGSRRDNLQDIRREGVFQITLFCATNLKTEPLHVLADAILEHFKTESSYQVDNHHLIVNSSYKTQGLPDGAWFMLPITINYHII